MVQDPTVSAAETTERDPQEGFTHSDLCSYVTESAFK